MLSMTWRGKKQELKSGMTVKIDDYLSVTYKPTGLVILTHEYQCIMYVARRRWENPDKPEISVQSLWSSQFQLVEGIIDFDILRQTLRFEVEDN